MLKQLVSAFKGINSTKMVVVVRTDIKMSPGKMAAQVAHAAVSLYDLSMKNSNPYVETWLRTGQPKIVLKVDRNGATELQRIYDNAKENNLSACIIRDAGRTQIESGTITAVGIGPHKTEDIDNITKSLKLL